MKRLDPDVIAFYKYTVAHPGWTRAAAEKDLGLTPTGVDHALKVLESMALLRRSADPELEFDTVGPETAIAELLYEDEIAVTQLERRIAEQRGELLSLLPTYFSGRRERRSKEAIEVIEDRDLVRRRLADYARRAESRVLVIHPGGGLDEPALNASIHTDRVILDRGVQLRILLQHSTRHHALTQEYARNVIGAGAEIKTVPVLPRRIITFDDEVSFIPAAEGPQAGAVVVKEPGMVACLNSVFELLWSQGRSYPIEATSSSDEVREDVMRSVLELLAAGVKDEVIARRLGVSVRTCRRYIAIIMEALGAESRFQAGFLAANNDIFN